MQDHGVEVGQSGMRGNAGVSTSGPSATWDTAGPSATDDRQVRRAALRVGAAVGVTATLVIAAIALVTLLFLVAVSREAPGGSRPPRRGGGRGEWADRVVNVGEVVPLIIALALVGIILLALVAWFASRSATQPLAEALRVQRNFIADASHELRTPLTTLDSRIQLAQHRLDRGGDVEGALKELRRDAGALEQILSDLLLAAEATSVGPEKAVAVDVSAAASEAARLTAGVSQVDKVSVAVHVDEGVFALATPTALVRALVILLDNALGHSPADSTVHVTARQVGPHVEIRVSDQGSGIVGTAPDQMFERFSRGDASRRGFGLGLSLVRDIAERLGGRVLVERTDAAGTTFLLVVPAASPR